MVEIMVREAVQCDLKDLVVKFIPESIGKLIEKECSGIFPLCNVFIRKVKVIKSPKFDPHKLLEIHSGGSVAEDTGTEVSRQEDTHHAATSEHTTSSIDAKVGETEVIGL